MKVHTVILCPFMDSTSNMVILPQDRAAVKRKLGNNHNSDNCPKRIVKNTQIRKKGCDDPYGNGQGRNVRQDHA